MTSRAQVGLQYRDPSWGDDPCSREVCFILWHVYSLTFDETHLNPFLASLDLFSPVQAQSLYCQSVAVHQIFKGASLNASGTGLNVSRLWFWINCSVGSSCVGRCGALCGPLLVFDVNRFTFLAITTPVKNRGNRLYVPAKDHAVMPILSTLYELKRSHRKWSLNVLHAKTVHTE